MVRITYSDEHRSAESAYRWEASEAPPPPAVPGSNHLARDRRSHATEGLQPLVEGPSANETGGAIRRLLVLRLRVTPLGAGSPSLEAGERSRDPPTFPSLPSPLVNWLTYQSRGAEGRLLAAGGRADTPTDRQKERAA